MTLFESAASVTDDNVREGSSRHILLGLERKARAHLELVKALRIRLTKALALTTAAKSGNAKPAKGRKKGKVA